MAPEIALPTDWARPSMAPSLERASSPVADRPRRTLGWRSRPGAPGRRTLAMNASWSDELLDGSLSRVWTNKAYGHATRGAQRHLADLRARSSLTTEQLSSVSGPVYECSSAKHGGSCQISLTPWGSKTQVRSRGESVILMDEPAQEVPPVDT